MEEKNINEKESLEIISRMIQNTRKNKVSAKPYLWLGYTAAVGSVIVNALTIFVDSPWCAIVNYGFFTVLVTIAFLWFMIGIICRSRANGIAVSYIEKLNNASWGFVVIFMLLLLLVSQRFIQQSEDKLLVLGIMQFVLACILYAGNYFSTIAINEKYKVFSWVNCFAIGTLFGLGSNIGLKDGRTVLIMFSIELLFIIIVTLIVPGHKIRKENVK